MHESKKHDEMKTIITMIMAAAMITACGSDKRESQAADGTFKTESVKFEKKEKKAEATIEAEYPTGGNTLLVNAVREYISEGLGGTYTGDLAQSDSLLDFYGKNMLAGMEEMASEYDGEDMITMTCSEEFKVECETDKYITYTQSSYNYTGGAHGLGSFAGTTFRKSDGRRFGYDMLHGTSDDGFRMLMKEGVKEYFMDSDNGPVTDSTLPDYLLNVDDINYMPLPQTEPYLTEKGMVFVYQSYEIAPYAAGQPTFIVPYSKIKPYMTVTALRLVE